jgi:HAD superfamily hydrolase (TIGR01509 family)
MFPLSEPPALVLFDCDGVLVDSEPISNVIFTQQLNDAGVALDLSGMQRRYTGMSMPDISIAINDEFGITLSDAWHDSYRTLCDAAFADRLLAVPHARHAVEAVRQARVLYCVASSGPRDKMMTTLGITGLLPLFEDCMFTGWDVPRSKPHPDLFLLAASHFGVSPQQCVVIEDSVAGVRAGVAAGMPVLGYTPASNPHILADEQAHLFSNMQILPALLGL